MNAAVTARLVAAGRIGFGVALIVAPGRVTSPWLGRDASRAGARVLSRGLGSRDLALGVGALVVSEDQLRLWMAAGIVADTADLAATLAAGDALPLAGRGARRRRSVRGRDPRDDRAGTARRSTYRTLIRRATGLALTGLTQPGAWGCS